MDRFLRLVGRPYGFPSHPPETFDCWTLVKHVRGSMGLPCPLPFGDTEEWCVPGNLARATSAARPMWHTRPYPIEGDMAVLEPAHVGVFLANGVLHALSRNSSVVWTSLPVIRRVWPKAEWWTV